VRYVCLGLAVLATVAAPSGAAGQGDQGTPAKPTLAGLAWMAGHWVGGEGGDLSEETWLAPEGDSMLGMWRYVAGGKTRIFEILTITAELVGVLEKTGERQEFTFQRK